MKWIIIILLLLTGCQHYENYINNITLFEEYEIYIPENRTYHNMTEITEKLFKILNETNMTIEQINETIQNETLPDELRQDRQPIFYLP